MTGDAPLDPSAAGRGPEKSSLPNVEPLPANVTSIQPGGGFCMACELAWGKWRRWYLRTFRKSYIQRMRTTRQGSGGNYPHEILDPRDLKFYGNQGDLHWDVKDDPFRWRDRLPVVRAGLAEIIVIGGTLAMIAALLAWYAWPWAVIPASLAVFIVGFFRDPHRRIPQERGLAVSPADGKVFSIREVDHDDFLNGPAVIIDIFLSVFNVHINRVPIACRVLGISYSPGKFLNALRPEAAQENECLELRLQSTDLPARRMKVRQITGAIARRIVCWTQPGDTLPRGGQFGMIKLGSRTELTLPREPGVVICVSEGQRVCAGSTIMARYVNGDGGTIR